MQFFKRDDANRRIVVRIVVFNNCGYSISPLAFILRCNAIFRKSLKGAEQLGHFFNRGSTIIKL